MSSQGDLFSDPYPAGLGSKGGKTSRAAAEGVAAKAASLRDRVLAALKKRAGSPEEIAARLKVPVMNVRPRCSELHLKGLIEDSGARSTAQGGRQAIVWRAV